MEDFILKSIKLIQYSVSGGDAVIPNDVIEICVMEPEAYSMNAMLPVLP